MPNIPTRLEADLLVQALTGGQRPTHGTSLIYDQLTGWRFLEDSESQVMSLKAWVDVDVANEVLDLYIQIQGPELLFPAKVSVYAEDPETSALVLDGGSLTVHTFAATNESIGPTGASPAVTQEYSGLNDFALPKSKALRFFILLTDAAGATYWFFTMGDLDTLPGGSVTVTDYTANPIFRCEYDDDVVRIVITTPTDSKTFSSLSGGGLATYTVGSDQQDDLSTESALAIGETRSGYKVVYFGAATAGPDFIAFDGSIHGEVEVLLEPALVIEDEAEVSSGGISFVAHTSAQADTVNLPAFLQDDVAIVHAFRDLGGSVPLLPAGWTSLTTVASGGIRSRAGYRVLQTGDTTTGVWGNATIVEVSIYRGCDPTTPIGASKSGFQNNVGAINLPVMTLDVTDGSSWVVNGYGQDADPTTISDLTLTLASNPDLVTRSTGQTVTDVGVCDTGVGVALRPAGYTATTGTTADVGTHTTELLPFNGEYIGRDIGGILENGTLEEENAGGCVGLWAATRDGTGSLYTESAILVARVQTCATVNQYSSIARPILTFDMSVISSLFQVTGGTLTLTIDTVIETLAGQKIALCGFTPADPNTVVLGDFDAVGNVEWSTPITLASLPASGSQQVFTLNATAVAALRKAVQSGEIFSIGLRIESDLDDAEPTYVASKEATASFDADFAGVTEADKPKLIINGSIQVAEVSLRLSDPDGVTDRVESRILTSIEDTVVWTTLVTSPSPGVLTETVQVKLKESLQYIQARLVYTINGNQLYSSPITSSGFDLGQLPRTILSLRIKEDVWEVSPRIIGDFDTNSIKVFGEKGLALDDPTHTEIAAETSYDGRLFTADDMERLQSADFPLKPDPGETVVVGVMGYSKIGATGFEGPIEVAYFTRVDAADEAQFIKGLSLAAYDTGAGGDVDYTVTWTVGTPLTDSYSITLRFYIEDSGGQWTLVETAVESTPKTNTTKLVTDVGGGNGFADTTHRVVAKVLDSSGNTVATYIAVEIETV